MNIKPISLMGFHTLRSAYHAGLTTSESPKANSNITDDHLEPETNRYVVINFNAMQVLGYLPFVGIYKAALDFNSAALGCYYGQVGQYINKSGEYVDKTPKIESSARTLLVFRGVLTSLGLGILFLIPDIIASVYRYYRDQSDSHSHNNKMILEEN